MDDLHIAIINKKLYYVILTVADFGLLDDDYYEFALILQIPVRISQIYNRLASPFFLNSPRYLRIACIRGE